MQSGGVDLLKLYMSPTATPRLSFSDDKIGLSQFHSLISLFYRVFGKEED